MIDRLKEPQDATTYDYGIQGILDVPDASSWAEGGKWGNKEDSPKYFSAASLGVLVATYIINL
jgi:hypothetical protein